MPRMQRRDQRFWSRVERNERQANSGCLNKVPHSSKRKARSEADRLSQELGELIVVYKCRLCGSWHTGHYR
jgi:hypothetical protein